MNLRTAYEKSLQRDGHTRDATQLALIERFEILESQLNAAKKAKKSFWGRWTHRGSNKKTVPIRGLYIWGGVGRGKTFLMDLFFDHSKVSRKRRVHFHRIMQEVHARMNSLPDTADPLAIVADEISRDVDLLCFDEFFVSDIGDAMILGRLLRGLFENGVTLVATSNLPPDELYKNGLQRQQFLPAIALLNAHTEIFSMTGDIDYRLRLLQQAGTFLTPNDSHATNMLNFYFDETASSEIRLGSELRINGRDIDVEKCAKGIAWLTFDALCDGPRSQSDYIEIARWYPTVIISDVPILSGQREDQARRFIALIDEFYDRRVKVILSAAGAPQDLYTGSRLRFEFDRTISRLTEMQSQEYLALPHLA